MQNIQIDTEFQALIPALTSEEFAGLEQNILTHGCRVPLDVWGEILIDGHNRYAICQKHNLPFETKPVTFADRNDAKIWIIRNQFDRRNLSSYTRSILAIKMEDFFKEKAKARQFQAGERGNEGGRGHKKGETLCQKSDKGFLPGKATSTPFAEFQQAYQEKKAVTPIDTKRELAKIAGVSHDTIAKVKKIEASATPEVKAKVERGEMSINEAHKQIRKEERKEEQVTKEQALFDATIHTKDDALWMLTDSQEVVSCAALITDPPYGILDEPWEPERLEQFTREWAIRWNECQAETLSIFWSQRYLWEGRRWFDESFTNYDFQQLLVWVYRNNKSPQSRKGFKQTWEPVYFYRRKGSQREIGIGAGTWGEDCHDMDSHVAAVPQSNFNDADRKVHPAQKPVSVMRWLVNATTATNELIADPFCGSGTTGIAALQLGRRFHGIETNNEIKSLAERRIVCYGKEL